MQMNRKPNAVAPKAERKTHALRCLPVEGRSPEQLAADLATSGLLNNANLVRVFGEGTHGELHITELVDSLTATVNGVRDGKLVLSEALLTSQAIALDTIFAELARRAAINMGTYLETTERYLRLALKAQSQSRATLETLATIKNPPTVFAKQANINNGGQQQVNNGTGPPDETGREQRPSGAAASTGAHAGESTSQPNKLLEASDGERLDFGAQGTAGRASEDLAAMAALNRAEDQGRQGTGRA